MTGDEDDRIAGDGPENWDNHENGSGNGQDFGDDQEPLETEQLELVDDDEDERLPWLESDDDGYEEDSGLDTGKLLTFAVAGLVLLGAIVGGIWWATNRNPDPELVADGSTIEAPAQPYKEAPKDPGGKTFDGTGDSSFAVSEGHNRPAKLGDGAAAAPAPSQPAPAASAAPAPGAKAPAPAAGGVGVQVGAFSSQAAAEAGWAKLVGQAGGALSGVSHRVIAGSADIGTVYRLQAVAGDAAGAQALCGKLKSAGIACQVK